MSTRCVVKITVGKSRKLYYHHYDGYLSGVGYELFSRYAMFYEGSRFGEWYAEWRVTKTSQDCNPSKDIDCSYEPEEWGTTHDDIEFLYELDFNSHRFGKRRYLSVCGYHTGTCRRYSETFKIQTIQ